MSSETFLDGRVTLRCGDSRDVLKTIPDCSIDSIVTDPPYALVSIVKRFGGKDAAAVKVPEGGSGAYARASSGFMGKQWDTGETAFAVEFWVECLRVLKPGGHVVAFSGTRTYHRMACAIEDSGFEVRDMLSWLYGSGFPKSHDVSKGIDKSAGAARVVTGTRSIAIDQWTAEGRRRLAAGESGSYEIAESDAATDSAREWSGWGTALKPACEPICFGRKPLIGTVAQNVLEHGTGGINVDGCRVGVDGGTSKSTSKSITTSVGSFLNAKAGEPIDAGRWPANVIHDGSEEVVAAFPDAPGQQFASTAAPRKTGNVYGVAKGARTDMPPRDDGGSASRFFYQAKADSDDRLGSKHPTVKPVDLMQWLCRLVTPPGGTILDPFSGTGTTGEAAFREGFKAILIEREEEYQADIRRRMALCMSGPDERARESIKAKTKDQPVDHGPLFGGSEMSRGGADRFTDTSRIRTDDRTNGIEMVKS